MDDLRRFGGDGFLATEGKGEFGLKTEKWWVNEHPPPSGLMPRVLNTTSSCQGACPRYSPPRPEATDVAASESQSGNGCATVLTAVAPVQTQRSPAAHRHACTR